MIKTFTISNTSSKTYGDIIPALIKVPASKKTAYINRVDVDSVIDGQNEQQQTHGVPHIKHLSFFFILNYIKT